MEDYLQNTCLLKILEKENKNNFINRFNLRKMNISLIKTRSWKRNLLNSDEEENLFREAKNIMEFYDIDFVIGWGNFLLEESMNRSGSSLNTFLKERLIPCLSKFELSNGPDILPTCDTHLSPCHSIYCIICRSYVGQLWVCLSLVLM